MGVKRAVRLAAAGRRGFSQADAARWLGVPKRTYEGWERASGAKVPQRLVMEMLLKRIRGSY